MTALQAEALLLDPLTLTLWMFEHKGKEIKGGWIMISATRLNHEINPTNNAAQYFRFPVLNELYVTLR